MPESSKQNLSEISHLFLSGIRQRQGGPESRPVRRPPQGQRSTRPEQPAVAMSRATDPIHAGAAEVALSPDEMSSVTEILHGVPGTAARIVAPIAAPVTAVIAAHLGAGQLDFVRRYARHLCATGQRIGLIEIDAGAFNVSRFETGAAAMSESVDAHEAAFLEPRRIAETLEELNCDVDRWLVLTPSPRTPEARRLLRLIGQWTILSATDHDGIVACYRTLKGLADLGRPALHLAALDTDEHNASGILRKLSGVCEEFLHWPIGDAECVSDPQDVAEHRVMSWRPTQDKAQLAHTGHWDITAAFLERAKQPAEQPRGAAPLKPLRSTDNQHTTETLHGETSSATTHSVAANSFAAPVPDLVIPTAASEASAAAQPALRMAADAGASEPARVVDLPAGDDCESSILAAAIQGDTSLVEMPVQPPMCPSARLAVDRRRRIILMAVAQRGLNDLRAIAQAYQWMNENRTLIAMAVPQLNIDAHAQPRLTLLVDHNDLSATLLQPMFESTAVTIQAYRTLRWDGKMGLLLEAA